MKEPASLDGKPKIKELYDSLLKKYPKEQIVIQEDEKTALKTAIQDLKYPYLMHNILHYIHKDLAILLAKSSNPTLSHYGKMCEEFYQKNPLNIYVEPKTGIVVARLSPIHVSWHDVSRRKHKFDGQAIWALSEKDWRASPTTTGVLIEETLDDLLKYDTHGHKHYPAINPIDMSEYPIPLISPVHIAAAIGDIHLLKTLKSKGASLTDDYHEDRSCPLGFAILLHQKETVLFLIKENPDDFAKVVGHANFEIISEILATQDITITDEILEIAFRRGDELYEYLVLKGRNSLQDTINKYKSSGALILLLNCPVIPIWLLIDLIKAHPGLLSEINSEEIIHQLILDKKNQSAIALLEVLFKIEYEELSEFNFNIDERNSNGDSILDLALKDENYDSQLIFAILMHTPKMNEWQHHFLKEQEFDFDSLYQTQKERVQNFIQHIHRGLEGAQNEVDELSIELRALKNEFAQFKLESATENQRLQLQINELFKALNITSNDNKPSEHKNVFFQ